MLWDDDIVDCRGNHGGSGNMGIAIRESMDKNQAPVWQITWTANITSRCGFQSGDRVVLRVSRSEGFIGIVRVGPSAPHRGYTVQSATKGQTQLGQRIKITKRLFPTDIREVIECKLEGVPPYFTTDQITTTPGTIAVKLWDGDMADGTNT